MRIAIYASHAASVACAHTAIVANVWEAHVRIAAIVRNVASVATVNMESIG